MSDRDLIVRLREGGTYEAAWMHSVADRLEAYEAIREAAEEMATTGGGGVSLQMSKALAAFDRLEEK